MVTDNRDLVSAAVHDVPGLAHWPTVAAWWKERLQYTGPYEERTNVVFVPISADTGLDKVHPTWAGTYILNACVYLFPLSNIALIDSDCVPVTLFEIQELWHSSDHLEQPSGDTPHLEPDPSSPIAPAHKRSRSVDAGKADQPSEPPIKLPKSKSVENLLPMSADGSSSPAPVPLEEEVDFGGSESASPSSPPQQNVHLPEAQRRSEPRSPLATGAQFDRPQQPPKPKGIILVSEAFTEINAGLVIVLASGHPSPIAAEKLTDPDRDPDELATHIVTSYLEHVKGYLATTKPPQDTESAVASGLVGTPLLGTSTRVTVDWCHAWSLLGQWSGLVTFPVPRTGVWPRHGHLRGILTGFLDRQPNFHKWARPAYEQGALPTLSVLPGAVSIRVLPGDKMYQAMEVEPDYMRPVILHGFGTSAKRRMPARLKELAQFGWLPLAAARPTSARENFTTSSHEQANDRPAWAMGAEQ